MRRPNNREWKILALLLVVVPVSFLSILALINSGNKPLVISETVVLETVRWECDRPAASAVNWWETVEALHSNEEISINQTIYMDDFQPHASGFGESAFASFRFNATARVSHGHIEKVYLVLSEEYAGSDVYFPFLWDVYQQSSKYVNLSIVSYAYSATFEEKLEGNLKAFLKLEGINNPSGTHLSSPIDWVLRSPCNQTHEMEILCEITYYNGTVYKRVVQPFRLRIYADDNNSFEKAQEIGYGAFRAYIDGGKYGGADPVDYYGMWLDEGDVVKVEIAAYYPRQPDAILGLDLLVYNPQKELKACTLYEDAHREWITGKRHVMVTADSTGFWYIQVNWHVAFYLYTLNITTPEG